MQISIFDEPSYQCTRSVHSCSARIGTIEPLRARKSVAEEAVVHRGVKRVWFRGIVQLSAGLSQTFLSHDTSVPSARMRYDSVAVVLALCAS